MRAWKLIATIIVVPILVGLVLLHFEYSYFSNPKEKSQTLAKQAKEVVHSLSQDNNVDDESSYVKPDIDNLKTLFEIAKKIYGSTERNAEYIKLVETSLSESKPGFAYEIAKNIYGSSERNNQYVKIVTKCIELERFSLALKVAENIYGSDERNKQYKRIIEAGLNKRKTPASNKATSADAKSSAAD